MPPTGVDIDSIWTFAYGVKMHARVALEEAPPGAPEVVLVHGLIVSGAYMTPLLERLGPDYRTFAPDLPGFGESGEPGRTLSVPELSDALREWMDSAGLAQPMLIGNSFGCQIVTEFARKYPGRVRCAVLVGPTVDPKARTVLAQATRWIVNAFVEPPTLGPILIRDYLKAGFIRSIRTMRVFVRDRIESRLPLIPVRTLVIRGALDPIVPSQWVHEIVRLLPQGQIAVIPGTSHTANYSAPLEVARLARLFDRHPAHVH